MIFSKYLLRHALSGKNCIGYYKNYDDHIKRLKDEIKDAEKVMKKFRAKVVDIIEYQLKTDEDVFERNLVVIKHV